MGRTNRMAALDMRSVQLTAYGPHFRQRAALVEEVVDADTSTILMQFREPRRRGSRGWDEAAWRRDVEAEARRLLAETFGELNAALWLTFDPDDEGDESAIALRSEFKVTVAATVYGTTSVYAATWEEAKAQVESDLEKNPRTAVGWDPLDSLDAAPEVCYIEDELKGEECYVRPGPSVAREGGDGRTGLGA